MTTTDAGQRAASHEVLELLQVQDFYARYAACICDDRLEEWPDFFEEECVYKIVPRINYTRGLPVSLVLAESRGGVIDRLTAIRNTMVFAPRYVHHSVSSVRIVSREADILHTRSALVVHETMVDTPSRLLVVARTFDKIRVAGGSMHFVERAVINDTEVLPNTIIHPF